MDKRILCMIVLFNQKKKNRKQQDEYNNNNNIITVKIKIRQMGYVLIIGLELELV